MVGVFSGKMTSGSSSSEKTPLLNGSHEGPTYAYSYSQEVEEEEEKDSNSPSLVELSKERLFSFARYLKFVILIIIILFCVVSLNFIKTSDGEWKSVDLMRGNPVQINVTSDVTFKREMIHVRVKGPFLPTDYYSTTRDFVTFAVSKETTNGTYEIVSPMWRVLLQPEAEATDSIILEHDFNLSYDEALDSQTYKLSMVSNGRKSTPIGLSIEPKLSAEKVVMAVCILIGLYILITFEVVHRTLAAIIAATTALSCLALMGERPPLVEVLTWIDVDVLSLLFGTMVLVSILCETGSFDYIAVSTYKIFGGHQWVLISSVCLLTAVLSMVIDNLATVLLMSGFAIRLCETMNIDSRHLLMALMMFSNIGGAIRLKETVGISNVTLHLLPAVILSLVTCYIFWRFKYRDLDTLRFKEPLEVVEVEREREVWRRTLSSLPNYTRDEESVRAILRRKIATLDTLLRKRLYDSKLSEDDYKASLKELTRSMKVEKKVILFTSIMVLGMVILLLILENIPQLNLNSGWIAVLGAISLLVLGDFHELEGLVSRVEWSTLLFLAALFVVSKALLRLDLVWYLVYATQDLISGVSESNRLLVAIVILIWISAISSSFILPFATVMAHVLDDSDENLKPLLLALSLGASLGGNGTLIASSVNVTIAGISEQHGHRFSFWDFFKIGFPVMLLTTTLSMAYLLICHVWIGWND